MKDEEEGKKEELEEETEEEEDEEDEEEAEQRKRRKKKDRYKHRQTPAYQELLQTLKKQEEMRAEIRKKLEAEKKVKDAREKKRSLCILAIFCLVFYVLWPIYFYQVFFNGWLLKTADKSLFWGWMMLISVLLWPYLMFKKRR